jgi:hypothetical protein
MLGANMDKSEPYSRMKHSWTIDTEHQGYASNVPTT